MKQIVKLAFLFIFVFCLLEAQDKVDMSKKPEALAEKQFPFPEYTQAFLKNGVKVFIIEDHEQPTIDIRLLVPGGISVEGKKSGTASMMTQLLTKGAGKRSAQEIAELMDGIGASISASAGIDYVNVSANCLKKHLPKVMEVFSDVVLHPTFPKSEFKKLVPQMLAEIKNNKSNPMSINSALAKKVIYGENHPYSSMETEESVKSIELDDVENYFNTYFKPNNATIAIVGDIKPDEAVNLLNTALAAWEKGKVPEINVPEASPMPMGVYFVDRPGSVQSSVVLTTKAMPYSSQDYDPCRIATGVIGAGFAGRLFRTLRETYSYTYTPFGRLTNAKYTNRFFCGADVRNSVTDSAINVIKEQLNLLATVPPTDDELNRVKKYEVGEYLTSFENSNFIASLIQNADFQGKSIAQVKSYPDRIMKLNPYDIMRMAKQYMNPNDAYIVVVGSPEVKEKLAKYGKIFEYDLDLNPLTGEKGKMEEVSLDAKELLEKYTQALGGREALNQVNTLINNGKASISAMGQSFNGTYVEKLKAPNKLYSVVDMGMFRQSSWFDGTNSYMTDMGGATEKREGKDFEKDKLHATMFQFTKLLDLGYKCQVLGKQNNQILMKATSPAGDENTLYFDANTYLLNKIESTEDSPQGPMPITVIFSNYEKVNNIMLPKTLKSTNPQFELEIENSYQVNIPIDDSEFIPPKGQN